MKLFFDFLPIVLFFTVFKYAEHQPESAQAFANQHLSAWISGGQVQANEAPILLATCIAILITALQIGYLLIRRRKVEPMLWMTFALVAIFGGATIWLHNEVFIQWKPTILNWLFAAILIGGRWRGRNFIEKLMSSQISLPAMVWDKLCQAWIGFFIFVGGVNLFVAFSFSTSTWVSFRLYGGLGMLLLFVLGQGMYMNRYLQAPTNSDSH